MVTLTEVLGDFRDYSSLGDDVRVTVETRGSSGETPLHWMAILGDANGVRVLCEAGADLNALDNLGNAPIHEAISNLQVLALIVLLECGADISVRNRMQQTPLELAQALCHQPAIDVLVSASGVRG